MKKYAIITVLNNLSETSMPYNEFVLYRHNHYPDIKQYVIVCDSNNRNVFVPADLDVSYIGYSMKKVRKTMKRIISECNEAGLAYVIHAHQIKSAAFFNIATFFANYRKKTVFTIHSQFKAYNLPNKIGSIFDCLCSKRITNVSATSYKVYPKVIRKIKGNRMGYIENGVDIDRIDGILAQTHTEKTATKCFIYVARMIPLKKHDFLIDVFSKVVGDYELILVGAEDAAGNIRKKVKELHLEEKVIMTGLIPRDELFSKLSEADVYVSTSSIEGLPVSVLEAMVAGLPTVISDIPPHVEIKNVCEEIEVLPFDENTWAQKINELISEDRAELQEKGRMCRKAAIENFSLQAMHNKYFSEYEKLLS